MQRRFVIFIALVAILASFSFLPLGGSIFGTWTAYSWWRWYRTVVGTGKFVPVPGAPDVYRFDLWWRPLPVALFPLTAVLVREGPRWVLIDAGAPDSWSQSYASKLAAAVKRTVPGRQNLDAILLTHGHLDHTGALPALLQAFPNAQVLVHEDEWPFLIGSKAYLPSGMSSLAVKAAQMVGLAPSKHAQVDPQRVRFLKGSSGDLTIIGIKTISWMASPGHSPGHASFLHAPSGTLILGDTLLNIWPSLGVEGGVGSALTLPLRKLGRGGALLAGLAGRGTLRMLPRTLTDHLPPPLLRVLGSALSGGEEGEGGSGPGRVSEEHLLSGAASVVTGAGDEASEGVVVKGGGVKGQPAGALKVPYTWGLPKLVVKVKPHFICPHPTCDREESVRSLCRLASLDFNQALPMHDAAGRGLSRQELQAFAAALPACR